LRRSMSWRRGSGCVPPPLACVGHGGVCEARGRGRGASLTRAPQEIKALVESAVSTDGADAPAAAAAAAAVDNKVRSIRARVRVRVRVGG
jgi:hypothetical protein